MAIWREVEDALEAIIDDYEKVNHVISLFQDNKVRRKGLKLAGRQKGVGLELGSGPGNFTTMILRNMDGFQICLDYSVKMLTASRKRLKKFDVAFVRGIFEALPFKKNTVTFVAISYALRDSTDQLRVLTEVENILRKQGKLLIIDVGKPNNPIFRGFFTIYMKYIVPLLGGLMGGYGYKNPWSMLYETYQLLPINKTLLKILNKIIGSAKLEEHSFGGLITVIAEKSA